MKKPTLKEMQAYIANKKGVYGGRRFERATDEVPNLAKMYQPESLIKHFAGDNAKAMMTMNPADFERYASKIPEEMSQGKLYSINGYDDDTKKNMSQADYLKHLSKVKGFADIPFLEISRQDPAYLPNIDGHEGRHRNRALASNGVDKALVQLLPNGELRHLPRRYPEDFIEAMKKELGEKRFVTPESRSLLPSDLTAMEHQNLERRNLVHANRPQLPDFYAEGGSSKIPPYIRAQIEDFKRKAAHNEVLSKEYEKANHRVDLDKILPYEQWLKDNGKQKMAEGGKANLEKYLSDSKIRERVYHATPENFSEFKPGGNDPRMSGKAIWTSTDPKRQPASHNIHTRGGNYKQGTNVMPLHVKAKNPLMLDDPTMIDWAQKVFAGGSKEFPELLHPHHIDEVRKGGYDSIVLADPHKRGDAHEVIVFEPHQLKSAIGNRGTYDINDPDITKKDGGAVHMADGGNEVHMSEGGNEKDYRGAHTAPSPDYGAPMHDVSSGGMYPDDFYSHNGRRYYSDEGWDFDSDAYNKVTRVRNKPNEMVYIHRAIPTDVYKEALKKDSPLKHMVRKGDWVAINKEYAKAHGDAVFGKLNKDYKIASMRVPAKHVWTNADSIHEWGYHPVEEKAKGGSVSLLRKHGLPTESIEDAERKLSEGHLVFLSHEMDERPREVKSVSEFHGYVPDQIYTVHPKHFMQKKADGGNVQGNQMDQPLLSQYRMDATNHANPDLMDNIGVEEAIDMHPKVFMNPNVQKSGAPDVGGVSTAGGLPIGGVDQNAQQPGQQLMPEQPIQSQPQEGNQQGGLPDQSRTPEMGGAPTGPTGGAPTGSAPNLLSLTPQGQKMQAMGSPLAPNAPAGMAEGGKVENQSTRITIPAEGFGGIKAITVPRHMWEGKVYGGTGPKAGQKVEGMRDINKARAKVYGSEPREPLKIGQVGRLHKDILNEHFGLPIEEQMAREEQALEKLRKSKHIGANADTLDTSEKLDTVRHEYDEEGRPYEGFASKGVAGHSLYTSGHGKEAKHIAINTCPGATVGCSGGVDKNGVVDTSKGTCFAPNAEQQYVNAAVRRAAHEQAKHDPAMTKDWILAHTGALRKVSNDLDKKNVRTLFRPNVVDETDVSSRHVIKGLNDQREAQGKPIITANSYGKTNELHDPENGYHVTHSNVGPKTKHGQSIQENIDRDKQRVRNTILAANARGDDFENEQGNKTPPKGSYMVTNVRRGSPRDKEMQSAIKYAKYWSKGRPLDELTEAEKAEGDEAHYGGDHEPTTRAKAHYGHVIYKDKRYDYQNQHILHPRFVQVGMNDDGSPHMIPTDSRFKDEDFLPKKRFMTRNGKKAGSILMTTPTISTPYVEHHTSFTHDVNEGHIEHAKKNKGEYEIDPPAAQEASAGKEYVPPQEIKIVRKAEGGSIHHHSEDEMAFPERSFHAQQHNAHRIGIESIEDMPEHVIHKHYRSRIKEYPAYRPPVTADTMRIELMAKGKGK